MNETLRYYEEKAAYEAERYEALPATALEALYERWIPKGSRVLELGCGSGRDARKLADRGVWVLATDGSAAMLEEARKRAEACSNLRFEALSLPPATKDGMKLRETEESLSALGVPERFDALVAVGVLQHLDEAALFDTALFVNAVLGDAGTLLLAVPEDHAGPTSADPRVYVQRPAAGYVSLFERFGFQEVFRDQREKVGPPGKECTWVTLVFLRSGERQRAVSRLRGILEDEHKTATYKFALLRAVADINIEAPGRARFLLPSERPPQGSPDLEWAAIPFSLVVERWLDYFWHLRAGHGTAPRQIGGGRAVAFDQKLDALRVLYDDDWLHCRLDFYEGRFEAPDVDVAKRDAFLSVLREIGATIKKGPVTYTGSTSPEGRPFATTRGGHGKFSLTPAGLADAFGELLMPAALWNELHHSAPWFVNTVLIEWARLSARFSELNGDPTNTTPVILGKLLPADDPTRDTLLAQNVYRSLSALHCVWSDRPITASTLAVDHLIPWSRTHCNDLWNLLPTDRTVNGRKSDRLPSSHLLDLARPRLFTAWRAVENRHSLLFRAQAENTLLRTTLPTRGWETPLFDAVLRAADDTARQFGAPRWDGYAVVPHQDGARSHHAP